MRLLRALLDRVLPDDLAADLREGHVRRARRSGSAANAWYLRQAAGALWRLPLLHPWAARTRLDMLRHDLRYAVRSLLRRPVFSGVVVLTLTLAIGATTTVFSLFETLFLRALPVEAPERLVEVYGSAEVDGNLGAFGAGYLPVSQPNLQDALERTSTLQGGYAYSQMDASLQVGEQAERGPVQFVSASYFDVLGVRPALGRGFRPEEDVPGHRVAVLSHGFWRTRLGADPDVIGTTVRVNTTPYTVVGVAPEAFRGTAVSARPHLWTPLPNMADVPFWGAYWDNRSARIFFGAGRLAEGRSLADARAELERIGAELAAEHPDLNTGQGLQVVSMDEGALNPNLRGAFLGATLVLLSIAAVVLLIACLNVANLLLGRALTRRREMAIRASVGANRQRLLAQVLTESLVLFGAGGLGGILLAVVAQGALSTVEPPLLSGQSLDLALEPSVLLFTCGVTVAAGLLFGLMPAVHGSRFDVAGDLRDDNRTTGSVGGWGRRALVVGQMALSVVALIGAGLFLRGLAEARQVDLGFRPAGLGVLSVDLGAGGYGPEEGRTFQRELQRRLEASTEVAAVALAEHAPLEASVLLPLAEGSADFLDPEQRRYARVTPATPSWAAVAGVPISTGRWIDERDGPDAAPVVVMNRAAADLFWPGEDPVGRSLLLGPDGRSATVVGTTPTGRYVSLTEEPQPVVYIPFEQAEALSTTVFVRAAPGEPPPLDAARRTVSALDPAIPVFDVETATAAVDRALWTTRAISGILGAFGLVGLLLAGVGVYGVVSHSVRARRREMGLRMALGAQRARVLREVLRQALGMVVAGTVVGLALAAGVALAGGRGGSLEEQLHGVPATDPLTYSSVAAVLLTVAVAAAAIPAVRATRVDPAITLKGE